MSVEVYGPWSCTIQPESPTFWLRCPAMSYYLIKVSLKLPALESSQYFKAGLVLHAAPEAEGQHTLTVERTEEGGFLTLSTDEFHTPSQLQIDSSLNSFQIELLVRADKASLILPSRKQEINMNLKKTLGQIGLFNKSSTDAVFTDLVVTCIYRSAPLLRTLIDFSSRESELLKSLKLPNAAPPEAKRRRAPMISLYLRPSRYL